MTITIESEDFVCSCSQAGREVKHAMAIIIEFPYKEEAINSLVWQPLLLAQYYETTATPLYSDAGGFDIE